MRARLMSESNRLLLLVFLVLSVALLATACSGEDDTGGVVTGDADGGPGLPDADTAGGERDGFVKPDAETTQDVVPDVPPPDVQQGDFGTPCVTNEQCNSNYCIQGPEGGVCTRLCLSDCPTGWGCQGVVNLIPDVVFICVPLSLPICQPCQTDSQCGDGHCEQLGQGRFCVASCDENNQCAEGFVCDESDETPHCAPATGSCTCRLAEHEGLEETCSVSNDIGTCFGIATCDPAVGWTDCTATEPTAELCDGADNDCNGLLDDGLDGQRPCEVTNELGTCAGTERCLGVAGWVCDAPAPAAEDCDYLDSDCDGETDEPFKVDGAYGTDDHCGACNAGCAGVLPNATATCDPTETPPRCIVAQCNPGYTQLNRFQCIPEGAGLCEPCQTDEACIFEGARCLELSFGTFCGKPCGDDLPCPDGYDCVDYDGDRQCTPASGSCTCNESTLGQNRDCSTQWSGPDGGVVTCFGRQLCEEAGWSECMLPEESCDNVDNDCDGEVDETFRDEATGFYQQDANCGQCGNNCGFLSFQDGRGECQLVGGAPACVMVCDDGFFDVDDNPTNGCECERLDTPDVVDGIDTNCDGVDGDVTQSVFVSKDGDDADEGTIDAPLRTVQGAIDRAAAEGKRDVYVATGLYQESVTLAAGVAVFGGFSADFRVREPLVYETTLFGGEPTTEAPATVNVLDLGAAATTLDGFTVFGVSGFAPGESSVALYLRDPGAGVRVTHNRVVAGNGAGGARGTDGSDGPQGVAGSGGASPVDAGAETCSGETAGGAGGALTCDGAEVSGGVGGTALCPDYDESVAGPDPIWSDPFDQARADVEFGQSGAGEGGDGGEPGYDALLYDLVGSCSTCQLPRATTESGFLPHAGADGAGGTAGADGLAGTGCAGGGGDVVGGMWVGDAGSVGADGLHGGGGGGGGAGGGVETVDCIDERPEYGEDDRGGSGGGGGSGGCAASGGGGGLAGGGSFGILLVYTAAPQGLPDVSDNIVITGRGGRGGDGGNGGRGGAGGGGGDGGPASPSDDLVWCAAEGGRGGAGGRGGHGGGGGGGCGGVSYGLFVAGQGGLALDPLSDNTFDLRGTGGTGGAGGASLGLSGAPGAQGAGAATNF